MHCIEERMYDIQRGAWVACERCSGGLRLPQSRVPSTVAQRVIHFGPEPPLAGLRFSRVAGWGWVVEHCGRVAGWTHPTEKSAASLMNTSIHRLSYWQVNIRKVGAPSLKERSS